MTTAGWAGSLALLITGVLRIPQIAEEDRWSVSVSALRSRDLVDAVVAAVSTLVLVVCVFSLGVAAVRQGRHSRPPTLPRTSLVRRDCRR